MIINNDYTHPVIKELKITTGAERFAGTWHWTGWQDHFVTTLIDTTFNINDTTFAITAINDSTLMTWGDVLIFSMNSFNNFYPDPDNYSLVSYSNGVIYFTNCGGGLGGQNYVSYHTR